jgi:peptide/nickel transport system substrate-binding protein
MSQGIVKASRTPKARPGIRRVLTGMIVGAATGLAGTATAPAFADESYEDQPYFEGRELPPIAERLPASPSVVELAEPGEYGGTLSMLFGSAKDVRMIVVFGYARLVCYTPEFEIVPDILESFEVEEDRIFTLHLRPGHRWSDGEPFTTEDFRYWWDDVANNEELAPTGPPVNMLVNGEAPQIEIVDETTVRYSWSKANPDFLPALAGASPLYIFRPAHYLKQFHADYVEADALAALVAESGQPDWAAMHNREDNMYRNDNPGLPTLEPWMLVTEPPSERFVFERNPYYHRVDTAGHQLPYIDEIVVQVTDGNLIPAKAGSGEATLAYRGLRFDNYTFLKEGEERGDFTVRLWQSGTGNKLALYPNLNVVNPTMRELNRDVRFRRALSLGINRDQINQVIYFGLGLPVGNAPLPESPLFQDIYASAWAGYDPDQANALLDEIGLTKRNSAGIRLLPNGKPLEIIVETAGESSEEADVLELIRSDFALIGIKMFTRPSQREVFRNRIFAGETAMSVWQGLENGLPTAGMSPWEIAPTSQQQLQWPQWGQFIETKGEAGEAADLPEAQALLDLLEQWRQAADEEAREQIWHEMLSIFTDQAYTIGTVAGVPQPVVVSNKLRNVPESGIYNWDPGAHLGMYKPDTFWLDEDN